MTRANAVGAVVHTRPVGSVPCPKHAPPRAYPPPRAPYPAADLLAAGTAGGGAGRHRAGDVRDRLLSPLVPADPDRRTVRREGRQDPAARTADCRPTWADRRP